MADFSFTVGIIRQNRFDYLSFCNYLATTCIRLQNKIVQRFDFFAHFECMHSDKNAVSSNEKL